MVDMVNPMPGLINPGEPTALDIAERYFRQDGHFKSRADGVLVAVYSVGSDTLTFCITENPQRMLNVEAIFDRVFPPESHPWLLTKLAKSGFGTFRLLADGRIKLMRSINCGGAFTKSAFHKKFLDMVNGFSKTRDGDDDDHDGTDRADDADRSGGDGDTGT